MGWEKARKKNMNDTPAEKDKKVEKLQGKNRENNRKLLSSQLIMNRPMFQKKTC